jgi:hypothetical protein
MQIGDAAATAGTAQVLAQLDRQEILTVAGNKVGRIEHAPVLAASAHRDQGHFGAHHLAQRAASAGLPGVAVAGAHLVRLSHAGGHL